MTEAEGVPHYVLITTTATYRVTFNPSSGQVTRKPVGPTAHGWECIVCFAAEAPHYPDRHAARAAAAGHR